MLNKNINYKLCICLSVSPSCLWKHFDTETQDLAGIEWAPNGCVLAVWDTCLEVRQGPGGPFVFEVL